MRSWTHDTVITCDRCMVFSTTTIYCLLTYNLFEVQCMSWIMWADKMVTHVIFNVMLMLYWNHWIKCKEIILSLPLASQDRMVMTLFCTVIICLAEAQLHLQHAHNSLHPNEEWKESPCKLSIPQTFADRTVSARVYVTQFVFWNTF